MLMGVRAILRKTRRAVEIIIKIEKEISVRRYTIPLFAFLVGSLLMAGIYFGILTWAQGWDSALDIFVPNRWYVIPIWISFGVQASLYSILRFRLFMPL